jgi:hypothetical protein
VAERLLVSCAPPPRSSPLRISPLSKVIFKRTEGWQSDRALLRARDHDLGCSNQEFSVRGKILGKKIKPILFYKSKKIENRIKSFSYKKDLSRHWVCI